MLKCSTSLWSADLTNLAAEIRRVEPFSEQFHIDVADGHYVPQMLFFPDLVRAIRPHTNRPLEVHLMTTDPMAWIDPFAEAGADSLIFSWGCQGDPSCILRKIKSTGRRAGIMLRIEDSVAVAEPLLDQLDIIILVGTAIGIKGADMDPSTPDRIHQAKRMVAGRHPSIEIEADGGIRRETVPLLAAAGADWIVPGSLMFKEDPKVMRQWLETL